MNLHSSVDWSIHAELLDADPVVSHSDRFCTAHTIPEAIVVVFARHGPAASTEAVARQAGVRIGTVFRLFPTKDALLETKEGSSETTFSPW
jgi:hypothetical protein